MCKHLDTGFIHGIQKEGEKGRTRREQQKEQRERQNKTFAFSNGQTSVHGRRQGRGDPSICPTPWISKIEIEKIWKYAKYYYQKLKLFSPSSAICKNIEELYILGKSINVSEEHIASIFRVEE
jgi:hypothetical protein